MAVFGEAIAAVTASCNTIIVLVAIVAVVAGRGDVRVVGSVIAAALVGGWLFAADVALPLSRVGGTAVHVVVLTGLVIGVFAARKRIWVAAGLAGLAELLATAWWRPCVGRELANIINRAPEAPASTAGGMALYMLGLLTPAIAAASVAYIASESLSKWSSERQGVAAAETTDT